MSDRLWAIGRPMYVAANAMLVCSLASGFGFADPVTIRMGQANAHVSKHDRMLCVVWAGYGQFCTTQSVALVCQKRSQRAK